MAESGNGKHPAVCKGAGDPHHYNGMKTTYDATEAVQIGSFETIVSAWALHSFLPDDCSYGDMSGIWIVLSHDTCFRAGERVWLTPSSFMPRPRIKLQGCGRGGLR